MKVVLTDAAISKAVRGCPPGERVELSDRDCRGLRLRITQTGRTTWVWAGKDQAGKARRFVLGDFPHLTIAKARSDARAMAHNVKMNGADPVAERAQERAQRDAAQVEDANTLRALFLAYGESPKAPKSWPAGSGRVLNVLDSLLDRPCAGLTIDDVQGAINAFPSVSSAGFAARTARPALKWGASPGVRLCPAELASLASPASVKARDRVLSTAELARLLPVLRGSRSPYARGMLWLLLTLCRRREATRALRSDIDWVTRTWTIPATKNEQRHVLTLSRQAFALIEEIGPGDGLVFQTAGGKELESNWNRVTDQFHAQMWEGATPVPSRDWHRHDLRRTAATMIGESGVEPHIIEAALNHVAIHSPIASIYNRSRYRPGVAVALQALADQLDAIGSGAGQ